MERVIDLDRVYRESCLGWSEDKVEERAPEDSQVGEW